MPPLKNIRHENFCQEYRIDGNGDRSVVAAGFKCKQWKDGSTSASVTAHLLLKNYKVKARILELQAQAAKKFAVSEGRVLQELARIGMSDVRKILTPTGLADPSTWDDDTAAAVSGVEIEKLFKGTGKERKHVGYTQKVKLWDKNASLNMLAKHLNLFVEEEKPKGDTYNLTQYNFTMPTNGREHAPIGNGHAPSNGSAD